MALSSQFVPNELRDEVIIKLLQIQENKVKTRHPPTLIPLSF